MDTISSTIRRALDSQRPRRPPVRLPLLPRLRDAMSFDPLVLDQHACVRDALSALLDRDAMAAVVVDEHGCPVGEFSQAIALRVLASGAYHDGALEGCRSVREVMLREPIVVDRQADPFALAMQLLDRDRQIASVLGGGRVRAIISRTGLLALLARVDAPACTTEDRSACRDRRSPGTAPWLP